MELVLFSTLSFPGIVLFPNAYKTLHVREMMMYLFIPPAGLWALSPPFLLYSDHHQYGRHSHYRYCWAAGNFVSESQP